MIRIRTDLTACIFKDGVAVAGMVRGEHEDGTEYHYYFDDRGECFCGDYAKLDGWGYCPTHGIGSPNAPAQLHN